MRLLHKCFILLLTVFSLYQLAVAGNTGKIAGVITDKTTGEALAGVNIIVENTDKGAASDLDGSYFIIGLPPGKYNVTASYISYSDVQISNVSVSIDRTTTINIEMPPATLELDESIEVIAERPLVRHDLTSTESTINKDMIDILPVENLSEVVNLQAGVIDGHFRGGRSDEVQYLVNGVSVNDAYSGSFALEVENNAIQELNIISGTFNAEYGRAMSGIVNVVTREGGSDLEGNISGYLGSYLSSNDDVFWNSDNINPSYNLQGTLGGPIPFLGSKFSFFASGRYNSDTGYIYGSKVFLPTDYTTDWLNVEEPEEREFMSQRQNFQFSEKLAQQLINDSEKISLNSGMRYSGNLRLSFHPGPGDKLNLEGMYQNNEWKQYNHNFRLNPEGSYNYNQWSNTATLSWNHVFNNRTFSDVYYSYFYTSYLQSVYDNLFDPRYVPRERLQDTGANAFFSGGQEMWFFDRSTTTNLVKADVTSQMHRSHQVKAGLEARQHRLWMHEFEVILDNPTRMAPLTSFQNNEYLHHPAEYSAYIQDKMEYEDLIINAGLRYDYFDPAGTVPVDFTQPSTSPTRKAESSSQLSPRLGLAYPISAGGAIHVSYGHFFQTPSFFYLYTNPQFNIDPLQSSVTSPPESQKNVVGNAELKPQQTTIYELGIQQQLSTYYGITFTVYFKDIRNLVGTEVLETIEGIKYGRYINRDYGYVRGLTFTFERRYADYVAANIDYTFQIAKGNASDPNNAFLDAQSGDETEKQVVPLDWDRRHQINLSLNIGDPQNYLASLIARYGTGQPYTTVSRVVQPYLENGGRKPSIFTVDLYLTKRFKLGNTEPSIFMRIYNLFDRMNELDVYRDTGRATYSTDPLYFGGGRPRGLNTLDQYYVNPAFYSRPREIQLGLELNF